MKNRLCSHNLYTIIVKHDKCITGIAAVSRKCFCDDEGNEVGVISALETKYYISVYGATCLSFTYSL